MTYMRIIATMGTGTIISTNPKIIRVKMVFVFMSIMSELQL